MALRGNASSSAYAIDLVKVSKDMVSLGACIQKKVFDLGV